MPQDAFAPLPEPLNAQGAPRLTGVEIELGGLDEGRCAAICAENLGGHAIQCDTAIWRVENSAIGTIDIYLDTALRKADASALRDAALTLGREIVPVEIVTQPLNRDGLISLDVLRETLRRAGAIGSGGKLFFGFGVHLNVEIAAPEARAVVPPLLAYALIEDWLREANPIDNTRRVLPFTQPYPTSLVRRLIELGPDAGLGAVIDAYLLETETRNHGLDMLPVFAHLDGPRVERVLTDATSARPTFHFRLPDCRIDEVSWSLDDEWRRWRTVENVAADRDLMTALATAWEADHGAITLSRGHWAETAGRILRRHGIADPGG